MHVLISLESLSLACASPTTQFPCNKGGLPADAWQMLGRDYCRRARMQPVLEAAGILQGLLCRDAGLLKSSCHALGRCLSGHRMGAAARGFNNLLWSLPSSMPWLELLRRMNTSALKPCAKLRGSSISPSSWKRKGGHAKAAGAELHRLAAQVSAQRERSKPLCVNAVGRGHCVGECKAVQHRCEPVPEVSWPLRAVHAAPHVDP